MPPLSCEYKYSVDKNWCSIPKLVCDEWISDSMRIKLDKIAIKFLKKVEVKFWNQADKKINYIKKINKKLIIVWEKKPKYKNIINYLVKTFERKIEQIIIMKNFKDPSENKKEYKEFSDKFKKIQEEYKEENNVTNP